MLQSHKHNPSLIVVTGIDGSGKSTVCAHAKVALENLGYSVANAQTWHVSYTLQKALKERALSSTEIGELYAGLSQSGRIYYHGLAWSEALSHASECFKENQHKRVILAEGYWYKQIANEFSQGNIYANTLAFESFFPRPDLCFLLNVDPELARSRKAGKMTRFEEDMDWVGATHWLKRYGLKNDWIELEGNDAAVNAQKIVDVFRSCTRTQRDQASLQSRFL